MTNTRRFAARTTRGFTLIELLIAMTVAAILATVAVPSFADALRRARRVEGVTALLALQLAQERWRTDHPRYSATLSELGTAAVTNTGAYTLAITEADETGYVAVATAAAPQAGDAPCRVLKIVQRGGQMRRGAVDAHGVESFDPRHRCWQ